jgi:hypothetical protein
VTVVVEVVMDRGAVKPKPVGHDGHWRAVALPPEPHRLKENIDTTLERESLYLSRSRRIADVHHHREADHSGELLK